MKLRNSLAGRDILSLHSRDQAADSTFLRDVLRLPHVDAGGVG
jgi:hypothetical protein